MKRYERAIRARARRLGKNPDRAFAAAKAAVTRSAKKRGVDPARSWAATQGAFARASNRDVTAREHGKRAREATERKRTAAQKAAETRAGNRLERRKREHRGAGAGAGGARVREYRNDDLDFAGYNGEWDEYDVETSPDYPE